MCNMHYIDCDHKLEITAMIQSKLVSFGKTEANGQSGRVCGMETMERTMTAITQSQLVSFGKTKAIRQSSLLGGIETMEHASAE